jgi:hypothetical protein
VSDSSPTTYWFRDELDGFSGNFPGYTITSGEWVRFETELLGFNIGVPGAESWELGVYLSTGDLLEADTPGTWSQVSSGGQATPLNYVDTIAIGCPVSHAHYELVQMSGFAVSLDGPVGPVPRRVKGMPGIQANFIAPHTDTW